MGDKKKNDNKGKKNQGTGMCIGLALGTSVGMLVYMLTGSILWMPLCLGAGMCLGLAAFSGSGKTDEAGSEKSEDGSAAEDDTDDEQ